MVKIKILKDSASKKDFAPKSKMGLSQPIKFPSQIKPKRYINETASNSFK